MWSGLYRPAVRGSVHKRQTEELLSSCYTEFVHLFLNFWHGIFIVSSVLCLNILLPVIPRKPETFTLTRYWFKSRICGQNSEFFTQQIIRPTFPCLFYWFCSGNIWICSIFSLLTAVGLVRICLCFYSVISVICTIVTSIYCNSTHRHVLLNSERRSMHLTFATFILFIRGCGENFIATGFSLCAVY